jgi:hypothetical protein
MTHEPKLQFLFKKKKNAIIYPVIRADAHFSQGECAMKSLTVKTLAALTVAGGLGFTLAPAQAMPGVDPGLAASKAPMVEKVWCGPYGCRPGWGGGYGYGGYGWRPHPRPYGYGGYGWRPHPRPYGYGGYGWRPHPHPYGYGGYGRRYGW